MTTRSMQNEKCWQSVASAIQRAFAVVWICPAFHRVDEGAFSSTGTEPPCCQRLACSFASCRAYSRFDFALCHVIPLMAAWKCTESERCEKFPAAEAELKMNVVCEVYVRSHGMVAPEIVDITRKTPCVHRSGPVKDPYR
jgi:hypothetical protein